MIINGLPSARFSAPTSHGGKIATGSPDVFIGETKSPPVHPKPVIRKGKHADGFAGGASPASKTPEASTGSPSSATPAGAAATGGSSASAVNAGSANSVALGKANLLDHLRNMASAAVRKALLDKYGVVTGTYDELKKIKKPGYQREHVVPHSSFMTRSVNTKEGESRYQVPIRPEFGNYTEGEAITYFVYDDQSKGTEHRYITDVEKEYAKALMDNGEYATVSQWMDHMESATAKMFSDTTVEIAEGVKAARWQLGSDKKLDKKLL